MQSQGTQRAPWHEGCIGMAPATCQPLRPCNLAWQVGLSRKPSKVEARGSMSAPNPIWHTGHPMPRNPSMDQRVTWHLAHQAHCGCREIPVTVLAELKRRGINSSPPLGTRDQARRRGAGP